MDKVSNLLAGWEQEAKEKEAAAEAKKAKRSGAKSPHVVDEGEENVDANLTAHLFDDSSDEDSDDGGGADNKANEDQKTEDAAEERPKPSAKTETEKDLFGDSSDSESDEELVPTGKRPSEFDESSDNQEGQSSKKRRMLEEDD